MPIFKISGGEMTPLRRTTFSDQGLRERQDLQAMLKRQIDAIAPNTLVVAEEFGDWEDSRRRIDLVAIDKNANLVVIELKRTEDGGHMELQALRYAAMISTLTFEGLVKIYARYLSDNNIEADATENLLEFLEWHEPDDEQFAQEVKIVLASAEFSKELTSSVMWLNDFGLDIRCVRMHPYESEGETLLDVQEVIPIPGAADYQVKIREKRQREREARTRSMDYTQYDVSVGGKNEHGLGKGRMMLYIIGEILRSGEQPEAIAEAIPKMKVWLLESLDGELSSEEVHAVLAETYPGKNRNKRFFTGENDLVHVNGKTHLVTNQWGKDNTLDAIKTLQESFPDLNIRVTPAES